MRRTIILALCLPRVSGTSLAALRSNQTSTANGADFPEHGIYHASTACQDFGVDNPIGSGWLRADCMDIWRWWAQSLKESNAYGVENRQFFSGISDRLRQQGTPCYIDPPDNTDGAGSRSMRQIATSVYAEETGCDLLLPEGHRKGSSLDLYCHRTNQVAKATFRCAQVDWMEYFNMSQYAAQLPNDGGTSKTIDVSARFAPQSSFSLSAPVATGHKTHSLVPENVLRNRGYMK